jgi:hypothetical protein
MEFLAMHLTFLEATRKPICRYKIKEIPIGGWTFQPPLIVF